MEDVKLFKRIRVFKRGLSFKYFGISLFLGMFITSLPYITKNAVHESQMINIPDPKIFTMVFTFVFVSTMVNMVGTLEDRVKHYHTLAKEREKELEALRNILTDKDDGNA